MCPAVVPCATADEESGSSLKLGSCVDQPPRVTRNKKTGFGKCFLSNEPLHKILLSAKQTLALSLTYPVHYILFIPPSVGVVGLAEYVCTHPILKFLQMKTQTSFQRTLSRVPSCTQPCLWIRVTRRRIPHGVRL